MTLRITLAIIAMLIVPGTMLLADVRPHALISEGMVIQQGQEVRVWGTADNGEKVVVRFRDQEAVAVTEGGRWSVRLKSGAAGGPFTMTISGKNTIALKDVLVGEVWICSGQSNMGAPFAPRAGSKLLEGTANANLRLFTVPELKKDTPQDEIAGANWQECGPKTVGTFSAVAYYFGRDLQKALKVPVGLIHSSYGGSSVTHWTNPDALNGQPELKPQMKPVLYNGMIAPLMHFGIRGVIWYQGEADTGTPSEYQARFSALIRGWRTEWKQGDFPFLFVQIAPYGKIVDTPQESGWAQLREAQNLTGSTVPNTSMVVITDCGHETDIHPKPKQPVGERLALSARALVHNHKIVSAGPTYSTMKVQEGKIVLDFSSVGAGLEAKRMVLEDIIKNPQTGQSGGALHVGKGDDTAEVSLRGFCIAGDDRKFVNAQAKIDGDKVIVWSSDVPRPVAVRYGWADYPTGNLFNKEGLPASPFRTDDFPFPKIVPPVRGK